MSAGGGGVAGGGGRFGVESSISFGEKNQKNIILV